LQPTDPRRFVLPLLLALVLFGTSQALVTQAADTPQLVNAGTTECTPTSGRAAFAWTAVPGATGYWVDLSLDNNGFRPGTFVGNGPFKSTSITWDGVQPGITYYWRINALTESGWATSLTGTFVPCGSTTLQPVTARCEFDGTATVDFHWSPAALPSDTQTVELSVFDNGFAPGTYVSTGALSNTSSWITWPGILGNTLQFYRVTTQTAGGARSTRTAALMPCPTASGEPAAPPPVPGAEMPGERWILVDTSRQEATAMVGDSPLYTAQVTTGKDGWETPKGTFSIIYRVEDEKMTSESIGAEEYYVLEDVLYTQYFTNEGHALHLNYWRPDYYFGEIPSSHGCVGIRLDSAEFFWRFAGYGTRVTII